MLFDLLRKSSKEKSQKSNVKGYMIGVSSGLFGAAQRGEQISLIDLAQKGFYGALKGVNFTQIDLERSTEFLSPEIERKIKRLREDLGIEIGFHGVSGAMGAKGIFLDSAIEDDYHRTHEALVNDLDRAGKLKAKYYLQHASETTPYGWLGKDFQPTTIVDIWGRRFHEFLSENGYLADWAIKENDICEVVVGESYDGAIKDAKRTAEREIKDMESQLGKKLTEPEREDIMNRRIEYTKNILKDRLIRFSQTHELRHGSERIAYIITAKWMSDNNDPIWNDIVGKKFEDVKENYKKWVPAVSAKYIWGHIHPDKCPNPNKAMKDPKPILNKYNIDFVIETAMTQAGMEEEYRLTRPSHFVIACKNSSTKHFKAAIDFEHILGAGLRPKEEIEKMIPDGGKYISVLHVGWPTALQGAHYPIFLGSEQQEWLYRWMLALRKKGFDESENRYIIFERGSPLPHPETGGQGQDSVLQSVLALRKIIEYLRVEIPFEKLPNDFYGIDDKEEKMQDSRIREHALDPIRGMLTTPEGRHSYFGEAAKGKGKLKEWESGEKYR